MSTSIVSVFLILSPAPTTTHEQAQLELQAAATAIAERSPDESIVALEAALAEAVGHSQELLADPRAAEVFARARLALAWAQLAAGDTNGATETMDLAILAAGSTPLPLAGLGPAIRKLHDQRRAALEDGGYATIFVDCNGCEVLIDETRSDNPSEALLLGPHRVWLFDPGGELEPRFHEVMLDTVGATVSLEYRPTRKFEPPPEPIDATPAPDRRQVPRWVKLVGMGVGAGLLVTGSVLLAIDGRCQGGGTPTADNLDSCGKVWNHAVPSYALLGVGGGVLLGASVWLTVDEVRAKGPRRTSMMLGWTMRF
jgi:hypothetical protein